MVDENGEPLVVYHGSSKDFNIFGEEKNKDILPQYQEQYKFKKNTHYFHKQKDYAETFGSKYGGIEKPYFLNVRKIELISDSEIEDIGYWKNIYENYVILKGVHGVYSLNGQYVTLLNPHQIKLADGTNTTFDGDNPDIRFKIGGNVLLAPNGYPSNLTPEQYKLVRTPEFKAWFGDWEKDPENASKVVDENGEPLVVYHGSKFNFNKFKLEKRGSNTNFSGLMGFFFSDSKIVAELPEYFDSKTGKIFHCFLKLLNPRRIKGKQFTMLNFPEKREQYLKENFDGLIISPFSDEEIEEWSFLFDDAPISEFRTNQIVAFFPNQIKLADGTNTAFDPNNDDIRFKTGGNLDKDIECHNCGWEWDKKDSEKFDMYVCHKCGFDNSDFYKLGGRTVAQTPAPSSERIYGSQTNKPRSSKDSSSAESIKFDQKTLTSIENKIEKHNAEHPDKRISLSIAKAIVRRGMGAYSKSHRPTIKGGKPNSRVAWGLARLNAFIYKAINGKSKSGKYSQDNDLLDELGIAHDKFKTGGKIPKKNKNGNCYEVAGKIALNNHFPNGEKPNFIGTPYLVHGEVSGQGAIEGLRYGHAWIEDDVFIYDFSNGRELTIPKALYYQIGQIIKQQPKYFKYTFEEAKNKMAETGHFGSWDLDTKY